MGDLISQDVAMWLATGERGISSNTIVTWLTGIDVLRGWSGSHPHDPDDLTRCVKLLEACPSIADRFDSMRRASPVWAGLVDAWDELVATLDAEIPGWRTGKHGKAPKTYARMLSIIEAAR